MALRIEGLLKSWNDERGFGFIAPLHGGQDIFVHAKAFRPRTTRPQVGQHVAFDIEQNREGKKRAANVELLRSSRLVRSRGAGPAWGAATLLLIPAFVVLYAAVAILWRVPHVVGGAYVVLSAVCFGAYAADKAAANSGRRRTSEVTLLFIGMLGGWPGGLLAQQWLRHKTVKRSFRQAFWCSVAINTGAFVTLTSPLVNAWAPFSR